MRQIPFPEHGDSVPDGIDSTIVMREEDESTVPVFVCFNGSGQPIWQVATQNPEEEDLSYDVQIVWDPVSLRWAPLI